MLTHSTFIPGLVPLMEKLASHGDIHTIIPGRLAQTRGRVKSPTLDARVTTSLRGGGHKVLVRKGSTVQEVFVKGDLEKPELASTLERLTGRDTERGSRAWRGVFRPKAR